MAPAGAVPGVGLPGEALVVEAPDEPPVEAGGEAQPAGVEVRAGLPDAEGQAIVAPGPAA